MCHSKEFQSISALSQEYINTKSVQLEMGSPTSKLMVFFSRRLPVGEHAITSWMSAWLRSHCGFLETIQCYKGKAFTSTRSISVWTIIRRKFRKGTKRVVLSGLLTTWSKLKWHWSHPSFQTIQSGTCAIIVTVLQTPRASMQQCKFKTHGQAKY